MGKEVAFFRQAAANFWLKKCHAQNYIFSLPLSFLTMLDDLWSHPAFFGKMLKFTGSNRFCTLFVTVPLTA